MSEARQLSFAEFLTARHSLWLERTYGVASAVDDASLRSFRFTNLWRELDRGTVYLFNEVQQRFLHDTTMLICHSILYRVFNHADPYERVSREFGDYFYLDSKASDLFSFIKELPIGCSAAYARQVNVQKTSEQLTRLQPHALEIEKALIAGDALAVRKAVLKIYSIGKFTADQATMDFCWEGGPFAGSDFSPSLGPGARDGLETCRLSGDGDDLSRLLLVGDSALETDTRPTVGGRAVRFDMRALEHSLCEFSKYVKTHNRAAPGRAGKRVYSPASSPAGLPYSWSPPPRVSRF